MHSLLHAELADELREVVCIGIHVVALPRLARSAVAAPVMGDDAQAVRGQEEHLVLPGIGRERPAVAEHDRIAGPPVLVVDLRSVSGSNARHGVSPARWNDPVDDRWFLIVA